MSQKCQSIIFNRKGKALAQIASVSHDFDNAHVIPQHFHPEDQLIFASKGVMTIHTKEGIWVVPPLRAVWIPAGTPHWVAMSGPVSMRTLYFLPGLVRALPGKCFVMNVSSLLTELILHACKSPRLNKRVPVQRRIIEIVVDQLEAARSIPLQLPHPSDSRAVRIVQALRVDPGEQRTLQRLCKDCGASKRTIQRLFIAETKMTFGKWRQQLRLLHAMQLVASGEKVTGAALAAGYRSPSAFISMFRKQLGTTPTRYFGRERDRSLIT
ncbi:MAG TPA: helix-turn-helix transcriptional regulator [Candidatus Dormibacteraeota bacterium]|jgi:AraC-like DNA-binding protein|nr:helix-turn-helix transcriptional regulator [Candidatus Dormibacteraeota bacterium]